VPNACASALNEPVCIPALQIPVAPALAAPAPATAPVVAALDRLESVSCAGIESPDTVGTSDAKSRQPSGASSSSGLAPSAAALELVTSLVLRLYASPASTPSQLTTIDCWAF